MTARSPALALLLFGCAGPVAQSPLGSVGSTTDGTVGVLHVDAAGLVVERTGRGSLDVIAPHTGSGCAATAVFAFWDDAELDALPDGSVAVEAPVELLLPWPLGVGHEASWLLSAEASGDEYLGTSLRVPGSTTSIVAADSVTAVVSGGALEVELRGAVSDDGGVQDVRMTVTPAPAEAFTSTSCRSVGGVDEHPITIDGSAACVSVGPSTCSSPEDIVE